MQQLAMKFAGDRVTVPAPGPGIRIRTYAPGDAEALKDTLVALTLHRYDDAELDRDILEHVGVIPQGIFLAELEGRPVGTATGYITPKTGVGTLHMVSALPEASGRHLGEILCGRVVAFLLDHGVRIINLTTDEPRLPAIAVYLRLGFLPILEGEDMQARWQGVLENLSIDRVAAFETQQSPSATQSIERKERHG